MGIRRLLVVCLLAGLTSSCCGTKGRVVEKAGRDGFWHLERVRTSNLRTLLCKIPFFSRIVDDPSFIGERWWYVSPKGERTFIKLVNYMIPDRRDATPAAFYADAKRNLTGWGFTGLGCYTDRSTWAAAPEALPAIISLDLGPCGIWAAVFEDWHGECDEDLVKQTVDLLKGRTDVLGIFWEYPGMSRPGVLIQAYAGFDSTMKSKIKLVEYMRKICDNDVAKLKARIPGAGSFDDLLSIRSFPDYEGLDRDAEGFARLCFEAYGSRIREFYAKHLPQYLNLGPILELGTPLSIIDAVAPYADILTFRAVLPDGRLSRRYLQEVNRRTGRPALVLDFSQCLKVGTDKYPLVETEAGQSICYRRAAGGCASLPFVVGAGWTGYRDSTIEHNGLLDESGTPRQMLVITARDTNATLDDLHRKGGSDLSAEYFVEDRFTSGRPVRRIGKLGKKIEIDGDLADWPGSGYWLGEVKLSRDLDPVVFCGVRIGWDDRGLVLGIEVKDDAVELLDPRCYWKYADFIEVFLDGSGKRPEKYSPACLHLVLLPRGGGVDGSQALSMAMHHLGDALAANAYDFKAVTTASSFFRGMRQYERVVSIGKLERRTRYELSESSWKLETVVPWTALKVSPAPGVKLGFNLIVHRLGQREEEAFWAAPRTRTMRNSPETWGQLVLQETGE